MIPSPDSLYRCIPRLLRPPARALLIASVFVFMLIGPGVHQAQAQPTKDLTVSAATVFTPDLATRRIDVQANYQLTNVKPDDVVNGSSRSYFFTEWVIAVPAEATNFLATSSGQTLATTIDPDPDNPLVAFASIDLPFDLPYNQTVALSVTYTIPGGDPRSDVASARVNDSFLSFSIWTPGDPGMASVQVNVPVGFTMDVQGDLDDLVLTTRDDQTVLEAVAIQAPRGFFGQVYGRNDSGLITDTAELPGAQATVRAWPDDPEWVDFVVNAIEEDVPVIEELTGLDWPAGDIEVIETVTPYLYGYGGWFNASSGLIEIGDRLERDLILHELGHAWFNDELIDGRWITEGLAEEFASRTIEATSDERAVPERPPLDDPLRVPLAEWASPWTFSETDAFAYEQLHYNASWWVLREITNDIGLEAFSEVLVALRNDEMAYQGHGPIEPTLSSTRWIHLFDLLERRAQATNLDDLFSTYVLTAQDTSLLQERRQALQQYDALTAASTDWSPPLVVRREMSDWKFADAEQRITQAQQILAVRDTVDSVALDLGVTVTHQAEVAFETATSARDLATVAEAEQELLDHLTELSITRDDVVERSSALGTPLSFATMSLDDAMADIVAQRSAVASVSELRAQVMLRSEALGVTAPPWPASSEVTNFAAATSLAQARLATVTALEDASSSLSGARSLSQRVGLWGSNTDATLQSAVTSFEADELDDALDAAARTESTLAAAATTGTRRLIWAAVLTTLLLLTTLLTARTLRRT